MNTIFCATDSVLTLNSEHERQILVDNKSKNWSVLEHFNHVGSLYLIYSIWEIPKALKLQTEKCWDETAWCDE